MENISKVVRNELCTGCGTCAGICPTDCVSMQIQNGLILPQVTESLCTECHLCLKSCPGLPLDWKELETKIFARAGERRRDPDIGNFLECYIGYSNDHEIRFNASSGGVVTQLLVYALNKGLIDGALVVRWKEDRPLEPEPFIARTPAEVITAARSKYCPVAANVSLGEILSEKGRFAVVGLPCHIHGIRKAEEHFKGLRDKIVLRVGLFCGHTVNYLGTEALLEKLNINKSNVAALDYRGCGWPGYMTIHFKTGSSRKVRFNRGWHAYWNLFSPFFFTPLRCATCPDQFNELADISVGDAWLPELRSDHVGQSIVISRTLAAEKILTSMKNERVVTLAEIHPGKVKESQSFSLNFKKRNLSTRASFMKRLGKTSPRSEKSEQSSGFWGTVYALLFFLSVRFSSSKHTTRVLRFSPLPLLRLYFGLFRCLSMLSGSRS